ncbi:MAG: T9SS type A sorting domain-containing protein, partial [Chitinivibrionales bacterium]|nr:T9SS type A sorting domain-containing protein [Chitinivibrionales bacterium]
YWDDTVGVGMVVDDYRNPDSLELIHGTIGMEQAWENHIRGQWGFEEGAGDSAYDISGRNRHGEASGTYSYTSGSAWGYYGLDLGASSKITVDADASFDCVNEFTITAWIKPDDNENEGRIAYRLEPSASPDNGYAFRLENNGFMYVQMNDTALLGNIKMTTAQWNHLAATYIKSDNEIRTYINGRVDTMLSYSGFTVNAPTTGIDLLLADGVPGIFDDIRIYQERLSSKTLKMIYNKGYRSSDGLMQLRADNNKTMHYYIDGGTYNRHYPVFRIANWFSNSTTPYVYLGSTQLTKDDDFHVSVNSPAHELTIAFDTVLESNSEKIYIDDDYQEGYASTDTAKSNSWSFATAGDNDTVIVKNIDGNTFSSTDSNEYVLLYDLERSSSNADACGGIGGWFSSYSDPGDDWRSSGTNLIDANGVMNYFRWRYNETGNATDSSYGGGVIGTSDIAVSQVESTSVYVKFATDTVAVVNSHVSGYETIGFDASSSGSSNSSASCSWSHTIGGNSNRMLIVAAAAAVNSAPSSNNQATSVTYDGNSLTKIDAASTDGWTWDIEVSLWYGDESDLPSSGSNTVSVTFNGSNDRTACAAISLYNVAQQAPEADNKTEGFTGSPPTSFSTSVTTSTNGAWLVDGHTNKKGTSEFNNGTPSAGQSNEVELKNYLSGVGMSTKEIASAGSGKTMGWQSFPANELNLYEHVVAAFAPAPKTVYDTLKYVREYTAYPTGRIFEKLTITYCTDTLDSLLPSISQDDGGGADDLTIYQDTDKRIGGFYHGGTLSARTQRGMGVGWLGLKTDRQTITSSSLVDGNVQTSSGQYKLSLAKANSGGMFAPDSTPFYLHLVYDIQKDYRSGNSIDSAVNDIVNAGSALNFITGSAVTESDDWDSDGFNEARGWWAVRASNNSVHFRIDGATNVRYYPAFKITGYAASTKPRYVFLYENTGEATPRDTTRLIENYGYAIHHDRSNGILYVQLDTVLTDSFYLFMAIDPTLAVTMSGFEVLPGNARDTLLWETASEHENLGFHIYRRIKPEFLDSLSKALAESDKPDSQLCNAGALLKKAAIGFEDTTWTPVFSKLIPGAKGGTSHGTNTYRRIDFGVENDVMYQYKLVAVDFENKHETYDKLAEGMPRLVLPKRFNLWRNFPNPFRTMTTVRYAIPIDNKPLVRINIYNIQGRLVRKLVHRKHKPGWYRIVWDGCDDMGRIAGSGPYIYQITAGKFRKSRVMIKVR